MKRFSYLYGAFFLALNAFAGILSSVLYFKVSTRLFYLPSYGSIYLLSLITVLIVSLLLLKYYHGKRYWLSLSTGGIYTAAALVHSVIIHESILTREPNPVFFLTATFALVTGILYSLSLMFSDTGKQSWLVLAGICLLAVILVSESTFIWGSETRSIRTNASIQNVNEYNALAGSIIPLIFMLQFLAEARRLKKKTLVHTLAQKSMFAIMCTASIFLVLWMVYSLKNIVSESLSLSDQVTFISPKALTLAQAFEAKIFVDRRGDTLPYRLLKPLNYDLQKQYPLVVCLHHGGAHGTGNLRQMDAAEPAEILSMEVNMRKYPCFVFVPQCPPGFSWGGNPHQPAADSLVFKTIRVLEQQYRIDKKRMYVAGESMGGFGSWHFISIRPEMFAAAIPICGAGDTTLAKNIIHVPVWAFHGEKDGSVPVERTREMIALIKKAGGHPRYTEFPGASHNIRGQVYDTPGLLDWLFVQQQK